MKADLAIINGLLVDSRSIYPGVLYVHEGKIAGITRDPENQPQKVIDAQGLYILPGAVDGHVHMMDPGYTDREDFHHRNPGSRQRRRHHGDRPSPDRPPGFGGCRADRKEKLPGEPRRGRLRPPGGLSLTNLKALRGMWEAGALGFKGFTCALHEADALLSGNLMEILDEIRRFDGIALFHCEDDSLLKKKEEQLRKQGRKDPLSVSEWRSPEAEELAVRNLIYAAEKTGARVAVAHTSLPSLVLEQAAARARGISLYTETCAQYLYLTEEDLKAKGPFAKFTPPPRKKGEVEKMRWCLAQGLIDMVNSDHCPYPYADKEAGMKDIWQAPFGIPGVETATLILLDLVSRGLLTFPQVAYLPGAKDRR